MYSRIIISFIFILSLVSCGGQNVKHTPRAFILKTYDVAKDGDFTPVSIEFLKPIVAGDTFTIKYKDYTVTKVSLTDGLNLKSFRVRIKALGTGTLNVALERKGKPVYRELREIKVLKHSAIPLKNTLKLSKKIRINKGMYQMIINNDSAASGYVKKVVVDFGHGKVIATGSKYLSSKPYFAFKPINLGKKQSTNISLSK